MICHRLRIRARGSEMNDWKPEIRRYALASKVLAVARTRIEGTWRAYIDAVPGKLHDVEQQYVLDRGDKMDEGMARMLFPEFNDLPYAR